MTDRVIDSFSCVSFPRAQDSCTQAYPARWGGVGDAKNLNANLLQIQHNEPRFPKIFLDLCVSVPTCAGVVVVFLLFGLDEAGNLVVLRQKGKIFRIFLFSLLFIYLLLSNIKFIFSCHE